MVAGSAILVLHPHCQPKYEMFTGNDAACNPTLFHLTDIRDVPVSSFHATITVTHTVVV